MAHAYTKSELIDELEEYTHGLVICDYISRREAASVLADARCWAKTAEPGESYYYDSMSYRLYQPMKWLMTKKEFERLKKALAENKIPKNSEIRVLQMGSFNVEIIIDFRNLTTTSNRWKNKVTFYPEIFILGLDEGYGKTDKGTPYSLIDNDMSVKSVKINGTFEEFKNSFTKAFFKYLDEDVCASDFLNDNPSWADEEK